MVPGLQKTVFDPGDEYAVHSGGKGGLEIGARHIAQGANTPTQDVADQLGAHDGTESFSAHAEARLLQWEHWMDQVGFENLW